MIEYEVTVDITDTDREAYKIWLDTYTSQTKTLPGFIDVKCSITKVIDKYYSCIRYIVSDKKVLESFIANKEKAFQDIDRALKKRILNEGDI